MRKSEEGDCMCENQRVQLTWCLPRNSCSTATLWYAIASTGYRLALAAHTASESSSDAAAKYSCSCSKISAT